MAGSPFHKAEEAAPISDVNVVPLADVSLVLLIILLVLSPMAAQSMLKVQAAAAKAEAAPPPVELTTQREPEAALVVAVTEAGFVVGGRFSASADELRERLKLELSGRADRKVFVSPGLDIPHGRVVAALEAAQAAGGAPALVQILDPQAP